MPSRFDYIKYDDEAIRNQNRFKSLFVQLDIYLAGMPDGRAKSLVLTKLEEAYMWVGKAIRDEQIARTGGKVEEQPGRKDG